MNIKVRIVVIYGEGEGKRDHAWCSEVMEMIFPDLNHDYMDICFFVIYSIVHLYFVHCFCECVMLHKFGGGPFFLTSPKCTSVAG